MRSHRREPILPPYGKALCLPGTTQGGFTSPLFRGFALALTIFIQIQSSDKLLIVLLLIA